MPSFRFRSVRTLHRNNNTNTTNTHRHNDGITRQHDQGKTSSRQTGDCDGDLEISRVNIKEKTEHNEKLQDQVKVLTSDLSSTTKDRDENKLKLENTQKELATCNITTVSRKIRNWQDSVRRRSRRRNIVRCSRHFKVK